MSLVIFTVVVFVFSAVIHEYMHGFAAHEQGDETAAKAGRLTLNPLAHLDIWGSLVMPIALYLATGFIFGYAKPVPYNPYALRDQRFGAAKVAIAGPAANFFVAIIFGLILRFFQPSNELMATAFGIIVQVNLVLGIFNMLPLPGLDGSKVLMPFLPSNIQEVYYRLEGQGMLIVLLVIFLIFPVIARIINFFFGLIVGY